MKINRMIVTICFAILFVCLLLPRSVSAAAQGAILVDANGVETASEQLLTDWMTGNYAYIKLDGDVALELNGHDLVIDLAGHDLTVTGTGNIRAFDTANDTYDETTCGKILNNGTVEITAYTVAPNGNTYAAVTDGTTTTVHRISIRLSYVSLRTAGAGLYYKATYDCDKVLSEKVARYGVVVSLYNMPGADFATEQKYGNCNVWTVAPMAFQSGITVTSGSVFGIMKEQRTAQKNDTYARMKIYANAYVDLGDGPIMADTVNPGKVSTDSDFSGVALSLFDVMSEIDDTYADYSGEDHLQLEAFHAQWKEKGMGSWQFTNIGAADSAYKRSLVFDEGTRNAVCPVCDQKVQWTELTADATTLVKDTHYYLDTDIVYTGSNAGLMTGATEAANKGTVCLHLNGHDITATQYRAINLGRTNLNVMGVGTVTGNHKNILGATMYLGYGDGVLNLYSGTITKEPTNPNPAIVQRKGRIELYNGGTLQNGYNITPIDDGSSTFLNVYGGTVTGIMKITGGSVVLAGSPKIDYMEISDGVLVELGVVEEGARVKVSAMGYFTKSNEQTEQYLTYFKSVDEKKPVVVKGDALYCAADPSEDDTLYILTAAASNSHYFTDELYGVLAAAGIKAKVCNLMKSSTGINAFYNYWKNGEKVFQLIIHDENGKTVMNDMGLDDALAFYNWDIFNMQEGSAPHRTTTPEQAAADRRVAHTALVAHIREKLPLAKLYYQEIWSYDIGFDRFNYQMTSKEQQLDFSARIKTYTDLVCEEFDLLTIPCGQAWIIARESQLCDKLCARLAINNGEGDYYHDGDIGGGQYLNACVWFETLTGQSCVGNTFRPVYTDSAGNTYTLSEDLITVLQQAAHEAVANMRAEN